MPQQILIKRGDNSQISPHFKTSEFYSKSVDAPASHIFYQELVAAVEYLRVHYNTPWRATSTFRTKRDEAHILEMLGVPFFVDVHMMGQAADSQPIENRAAIMADITKQFLTGGEVYQHLREMGINGFGLYDTFIHLDVRQDHTPHADKWGHVAHWDSRHNNADSPWGVAFANQKKSPAPATSPSRTPTPTTPTPTSPPSPQPVKKVAIIGSALSSPWASRA